MTIVMVPTVALIAIHQWSTTSSVMVGMFCSVWGPSGHPRGSSDRRTAQGRPRSPREVNDE